MSAIEREFERQKAWIAHCDDPQAILDRMGEYREAERAAVRVGNALGRARCADLLEIAENRVVAIKRARLKEARPKVEKVEAPARQVIAPSPPPRRAEVQVATSQQESRDAATRLANAQAAKIEAEAALLRAQAEAARRVAAPSAPATVAAPAVPLTPATVKTKATPTGPTRAERTTVPAPAVAPKAPAPVPPKSKEPTPNAVVEHSAADRLALMSVGRWPPTGPKPGSVFYAPDQDWPPEWTLTGYDVAIFRGRLNVSRSVLAGQLGVETAEVARAEAAPKAKVGPAMQVALARAMVEARARFAPRERTATTAAEPREEAEPPVVAPAPAAATVASTSLTGADLVRWRSEAKLSQREAAVRFAVAPSTVAKAEIASGKALGEQLAAALGAAMRG